MAGTVINVATGQRQTLNRAFQLLSRIIGMKLEPVYAVPRPGDIPHSGADITLARRLLGYEPKVFFEEGLRKTVEWYRTNGER